MAAVRWMTLCAVAGLLVWAVPAVPRAQDSLDDLPEAPERVLVFATCTACHGIKLVKAQGLSAERWDEIIQVMIDKNGLRLHDPEARGRIVAYLARFFPEHRPPAAPPTGELADMPDGPGRTLTFATCTACHGIRIVKAQGMSRARWEEIIQVMIEKNGMPAPDPAVREQILSYLAAAFPERRGRPSPFLR